MSGRAGRGPVYAAEKLPGWQGLNARLRPALLQMAAELPDAFTHNPTGRTSYFANKWLSPRRLHETGPPVCAELAQAITAAARQLPWVGPAAAGLQVEAFWAIVSRADMWGGRHSHRGRVSAAYYVDAGASGPEDEAGRGGQLRFHAGHKAVEPLTAITPEDGLLVLFPSRQVHSVSAYRSTAPRIVISANLS